MECDVDVTLIDAMRGLTPLQRIRQNDRVLQMLEELRGDSSNRETILATLAAADVEMIVVGMLVAMAEGADVSATHNLEIVPCRTPDNIARLVTVLVDDLDARFRDDGDEGAAHWLLQTRLGPLDVLGAFEGDRDYDALVPHSHSIEVSGHEVRVLDLAMLIELKRGSTRRKDQLALPVLEETLRRRATLT